MAGPTGGSVAQREAWSLAMALVLADLLMSRSCTAAQLEEWSDRTGVRSPNWIAYELVSTPPGSAWWVGHMSFIAARWAEVAQSVGMDPEAFRPMREMFYPALYEACAAHVRKFHHLPDPQA